MLSARDLSFSYETGTFVLDRWSADFAAGELAAVTGPSGSGKSTLLYLLGLMLKPTQGEVLIKGDPAGQLNDARRARLRAHLFGFVFQDAALDATRTVIDNVVETALYRGEPRTEAIARAKELLSHFGVAVRSDAKPGQVSGGQAQRIALCRALLARPAILLADEPTGNLDPESADVVVDAFRAHARSGATVIVVTHDPSLVARCDREIRL